LEILDIINTILDLSTKSSEFSEEIANLNLTIRTIKTSLIPLSKSKRFEEQTQVLKEILEEAQAVMEKCTKKTSWWTNIRSMFPGSELSQIKELNEKLRNTASLMNFSINTATTVADSCSGRGSSEKKPIKKKKTGADDVMISETLAMPDPEDFTKETQPFPGILTGTAFSIEFFGTKEYEGVAKKCDIHHIFTNWAEPEIKISRTMFSEFPKSVITFISKEHAVILGKCSESTPCSQSSLTQKPSSKRPSTLKPELERANTKKIPNSKFAPSDDDELVLSKDHLKKFNSKRESIDSSKDGTGKKSTKQVVQFKEEDKKEREKESEKEKKKGTQSEKEKEKKEEEILVKINPGSDSEEDNLQKKRRTSSSACILQSPPDSFFMTAPDEMQNLDGRVETFEIVDSSSNGTYLNGKKLKKGEVKQLNSGDIIGILPKIMGSKEFSIGYIFRDAR